MQGFNEIGFQSKDEGQDVQYTTVFTLEDDEIELSLLIPHNVEEQGKIQLVWRMEFYFIWILIK